MKPFNQLTPRQQFFRKNLVSLVIYGCFLLVLYWSVSKIYEIAQEKGKEVEQKKTKLKAV